MTHANDSGPLNLPRALLALVLEWYASAEVFVIVAAQDKDTRLPEACSGFTCLRIEPNNPTNVQGLRLAREGFSGRFSFGGAPFEVFVPWRALINIQVPEFAVAFKTATVEAEAPRGTDEGSGPRPPSQPPKLRIVK